MWERVNAQSHCPMANCHCTWTIIKKKKKKKDLGEEEKIKSKINFLKGYSKNKSGNTWKDIKTIIRGYYKLFYAN